MVAYRTNDPSMAVLLTPMYLDIWESKEEVCYNVCKLLNDCPDDVLYLMMVENDEVTGIILSYIVDNKLIIWQSNGVDVKSFEQEIVSWGKSRGCDTMIIYTHRSPKAWARKYKLKLDKTERVNGMMKYEMSRAI